MASDQTTVREGRRDKGGLNDGPGDYRPEPPSALKPRTTAWTGYWNTARHHYFRDHEISGAWGVGRVGIRLPIAVGLDKSVAAAVACLLNGDVGKARSLLDGLPERIEIVS